MKRSITLLPLCAALLCSCATLVTGPKADVTIDGPISGPVNIYTNTDTYLQVTLPQEVSVSRRRLTKDAIRVEADSQVVARIVPDRAVNGFAWGNIATGGLLGLAVDASTGAMYKPEYDRYIITADGWMGQKVPSAWKRYSQRAPLYRHEFSLGAGFAPAFSHGRYDQMIGYLQDTYHMDYDDDFFCGINLGPLQFHARYFYHLSPRWAVGVMAGYATECDGMCTVNHEESLGEHVLNQLLPHADGHVRQDAIYVMPAAKWYWYDTRHVSFYSAGAVGVQRQHIWYDVSSGHLPESDSRLSDRRWRLAGQLTLLGLEFGRKNVRYHVELGYGTAASINVGLSYHFGTVGL